jgi:endoglycosylceramidase
MDHVADAVGRSAAPAAHPSSRFHVSGTDLIDPVGRTRTLHGINLVAKGETGPTDAIDPASFRGGWTRTDLAQLRDMGLDAVRLGVLWAAAEPVPGRFDGAYLDWIGAQLDVLGELGFAVVLDAHQDLYAQRFGDGAPDWATLTDRTFSATDLWSDAYLSSPAVHEAYDAFWSDARVPAGTSAASRNVPAGTRGPEDVPAGTSPGPAPTVPKARDTAGVGLQDAFAAFWYVLASRFGDHPAVIGYDVLNEPTPGALAQDAFAALVGSFAELTGQDPARVAADFSDPGAKLALLGRLEDPAVHRGIGDAVAPLLASFERDAVGGLYARVVPVIRACDPDGLILREHNYFSNLGVPSAMPALDDDAWVYSPHGYDLVVDTDAMPLASDTRIDTIFRRAAETQQRLDVPVMVGEWGGFGRQEGIARHARFQLDLFDELGWSWFYWAWEPGFARTEAARVLTDHLHRVGG